MKSTNNALTTKSGVELAQRFKTRQGFVVERVVDEIDCGSIIAMAFNEFGHIVASQENGPLLLIYETGDDKKIQRIRTYCDLVKNVQGILPLNGDVYVTGEGPEGSGLYRLIDADRDGILEAAEKIFAVKGTPGEHGAHQIALGPDGMLYVVLGNHVQIDAPINPSSPYRFTYEGDLVRPRREDPSGHAAGMKAPGGTVVRMDLRSKKIDIVAGGLRNAYDLAFHPMQGLYVQDSDMEADIGTTWHRTTNLFKITEGGEYGWRSGWAAWPEYYMDRLPAMAETGRGSPTGAVFYDHYQYPAEYHEKLFVGDWAQGRIVQVDLEPNKDGTLKEAKEFVSGTPMNVTDLEVGQDGSLYFSTGGRGTGGGVYRVRWTGEPMLAESQLGDGISRAIRQPQMTSAWARQSVAMKKRELGDKWNDLIAGVAFSPDNPSRYRIRALDLMQLVGPVPSANLLIDLSRTPNEALRAKVAEQLAFHADETLAVERLKVMLRDNSRVVQKQAAEALIRIDTDCELEELMPLLKSPDREHQYLARRLLLRSSHKDWSDQMLTDENSQVVLNGALAAIISEPSPENAAKILDRLHALMEGFLSDEAFVNLIRVYQVVLHLAPSTPEQLARVSDFVDREFPAGEPVLNRELVRLAAFAKTTSIADRVVEFARSNAPLPDRVHIAMYACAYYQDWSSEQRIALLEFFEQAAKAEGGSSYELYIMQTSQELARSISTEEAVAFLKKGEQYPNATLAGLPKLPEQLTIDLFEDLVRLDIKIDKSGFEDDIYKRLKTGITATLAQSGDDRSMRYLRQVWRRSPDRRPSVALALAQKPEGENWDYIVRSLALIEPYATTEVLNKLAAVEVATDDPEAIRQTILHGLKMRVEGQSAKPALDLLTYWVNEDIAAAAETEDEKLVEWQSWFQLKHPERPDPVLPNPSDSKWSVDDIELYLASDQGNTGSPVAGKEVFAAAQCATCHRFDSQGTQIGPDLTSVASRFTRRETLESILFPSHVISDQYAATKILTRDGSVLTGLASETEDGQVKLITSAGEVRMISPETIEEQLVSKSSMMPAGLMDRLTQPQIRDLLAYMKLIPERPADDEVANKVNDSTLR
jgi:putative heme-binding domain-containing protein